METPKADRVNRIILIVILIIIAALAAISYLHNTQPIVTPAVNPSTTETTTTVATSTADTITAVFNCSAKKSITAVFSPNKVTLTLSDSRHITLLQALSASGARYATTDESFVFWNKGNTAFITENGATTFADCVTS